jgi:hypothetical protein
MQLGGVAREGAASGRRGRARRAGHEQVVCRDLGAREDHALGRNRGLTWERGAGAPGRAHLAFPAALALVGCHGRRAPPAATSCQRRATFELGSSQHVPVTGPGIFYDTPSLLVV